MLTPLSWPWESELPPCLPFSGVKGGFGAVAHPPGASAHKPGAVAPHFSWATHDKQIPFAPLTRNQAPFTESSLGTLEAIPICPATLQRYFEPHFTVEEAAAQRGEAACPGSRSKKELEPGLGL